MKTTVAIPCQPAFLKVVDERYQILPLLGKIRRMRPQRVQPTHGGMVEEASGYIDFPAKDLGIPTFGARTLEVAPDTVEMGDGGFQSIRGQVLYMLLEEVGRTEEDRIEQASVSLGNFQVIHRSCEPHDKIPGHACGVKENQVI